MTIKTLATDSRPHYFSLSRRPDISLGSGTLKKDPTYGLQNAGYKKQGHCYSKREEACFLQTHILALFFQGHKPTYVFKTRIVGAD